MGQVSYKDMMKNRKLGEFEEDEVKEDECVDND